MKKIEHNNFVGIYDNYFNEDYCQSLIDHFEWCRKVNKTYQRMDDEKSKSDEATNLNPVTVEEINFMHPNIQGYISDFNTVFWDECYTDYRTAYSSLNDYQSHTIYTYKIQKTLPGQGYHLWHSEDGSVGHSRRIGTYILYLNDVEEGGETEFLYLSKRIAPKAGRLLIFPPNYPWTHRGNPPLSGVKYIMTGWIEFS
jgi:hypothetical protein